ncbi:hypothetical protein CRYUN_Cryun07bG0091100 [Craigia yunnanensis]
MLLFYCWDLEFLLLVANCGCKVRLLFAVTVGSAFSLPYLPNYMSYARYEANGSASDYYNVSGANPPRQTHY